MNQYFLGIDASKGYSDFVMLDAKKQPVIENFQLDDTFEGHSRLYDFLRRFNQDYPQATIYAAVESTGGYENNWFQSLLKFQGSLPIKTAHLNPLGVSHNSKADLKRNVTDKISAQNVAEYLIAHPEKVSYQHQDSLASLRKQWGFISMLTKQSTQLLNQLESLVYNANPEILTYCKDGTPQWVLKLLTRYPTALRLSKAKVKSIARIPYVKAERAKQLVAMAKKSVASASDKVTEQLIVATVKQIVHQKNIIKTQTKILADECQIPEVALLKTFIGISDYSAIGLMLQIQSVERFLTSKKISSFFGIHPEYKKSGDGSYKFRMSKKGRKEGRRILFIVAMSAIQSNPLIRDVYQQAVERGMEKMAAMGLCMHKILRILYGMLKHNKAFDPQIDLKNRHKKPSRQSKVGKDKDRRYQDFDSNAPISRRQKMKRKERKQSQNVDNVEYGIIEASVPSTQLAN
ncbi:MAG: transposase [Deltaproteobacteria bacterium]|nr:transposase [Deltaproteobacteria bacterium]